MLKGLPPGDVIHQQSTSHPIVVEVSEGLKPFSTTLCKERHSHVAISSAKDMEELVAKKDGLNVSDFTSIRARIALPWTQLMHSANNIH